MHVKIEIGNRNLPQDLFVLFTSTTKVLKILPATYIIWKLHKQLYECYIKSNAEYVYVSDF